MLIKTLVIVAFLGIIFSLGSALFHLTKHKGEESSQKTVKALTFRISLSVLLFIFVAIALATGLVQPTGIGAKIHSQPTETKIN